MHTALQVDVEWLVYIVSQEAEHPGTEWSGYCCPREKRSHCRATKYVFGPFIDAEPANSDTILRALTLIEHFMQKHGQRYMYVVPDMQLYKTAVHLQWFRPLQWRCLVLRPGGCILSCPSYDVSVLS